MTLTIAARTSVVLSRETVRRELHTKAYVWKRARLRVNDDLGKEEAFFWPMNSIYSPPGEG